MRKTKPTPKETLRVNTETASTFRRVREITNNEDVQFFVEGSSDPDRQLHVTVKIQKDMTCVDAELLLDDLRMHGLLG